MPPDKIYLIHYTALTERLSRIAPTLNNSGIPYEIITQYDKEDLNSSVLLEKFSPNKQLFEEKIAALWDGNVHRYRHLNMAEFSCTLKHFEAIRRISVDCPNFGLILEDDVIFNTDFAEKYNQNIADTPNDWDAIFLGEGIGDGYINSRLSSSNNIKNDVWKVGHPSTNCAEAYMLKPEMAKKIYEGLPFSLVSDWEIAYQLYKNNANVYWWYPALATQGSRNGKFKSELDQGQRG